MGKPKKLWEKNRTQLNKLIERFEVGEDHILDLELAPYDIYGNAAHAKMLAKIDVLSEQELAKLLRGLEKLMKSIRAGKFHIEVEDEDIHTKIENELTQMLGEVGKKIHTARSRNDQVLVDTRLYVKDKLFETISSALRLASTILRFANKHEFVPMPGYTHMQIAMPSSVGMWSSSFVENILEELKIFHAVFSLNDANPLGSGAGYGVSID